MTQAADNPLSVLLSLETQTRAFEDINELFYFLVNEPYSLSPYRQAVLFDAHHKVVSLSGVANVERNTPFVQWLEQHIEDELDAPLCKPCLELGSDATDWLANHVLFLPVKTAHGRFYGTLLLSRDQDWTQAEISLLQHLMEASAYCWSHFMPRPQKKWTEHIPRKVKIAALIGCVLVLFFPVHLNVLAEAEIIAKDPVVIRAPMNGIVQEVTVHPNQDVTEGTSLVQMDVTDLENKKRIALKKLEGLRSEYRQTTRLALIDPKGKAKLVILAAQIKEQQANLNRLSNMIERAHIRAPHAATVILDDAQEWSAKPVQVGEKILSLADKDEIEIEAWLAVGDAIELKKDSELKLFLNASPLSAINGVINRISFKAQELPSGIMAHRIVATITQGKDVARLGAQGTARIEGERVSVFYWVFRRPIAVIRQFFGI
jgi:hypothetical protein